MTAGKRLLDLDDVEQLDELAALLAKRLGIKPPRRRRPAVARRPHPDEAIIPSELDKARAVAIAKRMGLKVKR